MQKKVSWKFKVYIYFVLNIGGLIVQVERFRRNASVRDCIVSLAVLAFTNFVFWVIFRLQDEKLMRTGGKF